jgi:hypothetical protein
LKGIKKIAHEIITIISCIIITLCIQISPKARLTFPSSQNPSLQSFKQTGEFNLQPSKVDLNQFEVFLQSLQKENRKNQKEKGKEEKGRGKRFGPKPEAAHGPTPRAPEAVPSFPLPFANSGAPPARATTASSSLDRKPREDTDAAQIFRNKIPTISAIITDIVCTYIKPSTPSPLPSFF